MLSDEGSSIGSSVALALSGDPALHTVVIPRACGVSSTPRPHGSFTAALEYWIARSSRAMTTATNILDTPSHSRGAKRPSRASIFRPVRAWGMPGAHCTRSLAWKNKNHTSVVTTGPPGSPGIPARGGVTAYFELSSAIGLSCHRRPQVTTCELDASVETSGPHDFAVRAAPFVKSAASVHRIPSLLGRDEGDMDVIWGKREAKYFL